MTNLEKLWTEFEARTLPTEVPDGVRRGVTFAYHKGALDMLLAINVMQATTPEEASAYLHALEVYCHSVLNRAKTRLQ